MDIGSLIRQSARRFGDAPALDCDGRVLSFREFDQVTDRIGNALIAEGMQPGDRVAVMLPNGIECLATYYALAKSGLVRVPLNEKDTEAQNSYKLDDAGCRAIIHNGQRPPGGADIVFEADVSWLDSIAWSGPTTPCYVPRGADEPYRLGYTGGTTGMPKAVTLTMRGEHAEVANFLIDLMPDIGPGDTFLHAAPIIHASGAYFLP